MGPSALAWMLFLCDIGFMPAPRRPACPDHIRHQRQFVNFRVSARQQITRCTSDVNTAVRKRGSADLQWYPSRQTPLGSRRCCAPSPILSIPVDPEAQRRSGDRPPIIKRRRRPIEARCRWQVDALPARHRGSCPHRRKAVGVEIYFHSEVRSVPEHVHVY